MAARSPAERRFVGRDAELAELGARLGVAAAGRPVLVLIEGEAGIGKTALLAEFATRAAAEGWQVARGAAWDDLDAPPFWPWTQVARGLQGLTRGTDLGKVVLDDPADAEHLERFELFDATTDLIIRSARRGPVLVVLDDLHAADAATLALTRFVVRHLDEQPVTLIVSYRSADLERRAEVRDHLDGLAATATIVRLGQLDVEAVAELLVDVDLEAAPSDVHAVTGGNPLFVEQLVRSGSTAAAAGPGHRPAQSSADALRAVIAARIAALPPTRAIVLAAMAIVGHEISIEELEQLVSIADPLALSTMREEVGELIELGLARQIDPDPRSGATDGQRIVEVVHSLIAEAAEAVLDREWSERLHGRAAALIGDDPDRSGERAHHLLRAGVARRDEAVKACELAGAHAADVAAHEEAVEHYQRALDALDLLDLGVPDGGPLGLDRARERRRLGVLLALGRVQRLAGRPDAAEMSFDRATELADRLDDPEARAAAALRGGVQVFVRSELDAARTDRMREALAALPEGDGPLRARLMGEIAAAGGTDPTNVAQAAAAVEMARRVGDPVALGYALVAEQTTDLGPGTLQHRLTTAQEILVIARRVGDPALATQGRYLRYGAALERGDLRGVEVGGPVDGAGVLVERTQRRLAQWAAVTGALLDGRPDAAELLAEQGLAFATDVGDPFALRVYGAQLGVIRRLQDRFGELEPIYEAQWNANPDETMWPAALASIWATSGRRDEARAALDAIGSVERIAGGLHWSVTTALAAEAAAIVGHEVLGPELWERLLPFADRLVPLNLGAAVLGPVGLPLGRLGLWLGHVDEGITHLERAVRVCARARARWWLVESQLALGSALVEHRVGVDGDRAADASRRVSELLDDASATAQQYGFDRLISAAEELRAELAAVSATAAGSVSAVAEREGSGATPTGGGASPAVDPAVHGSAVHGSAADGSAAAPSPTSVPTSTAVPGDGSSAVAPQRPSVSVLGAFEVVSADGRIATWSSRKARELLKILVAKRGAPVHREVLMDLLWPGEDPAAVGNRLSVALWTVRRALDPDRVAGSNEYLAADRQTVRIRVEAVDIDAERFLEAAQSALAMRASQLADRTPEGAGSGGDAVFEQLVAAAALHPGPALPDEPYADWAFGLQREVTLAHTRVLSALAEMAVERGDDLLAADAFRGLVEADPYDRRMHQGLVAALERIGATAMAEAERRRYDAVMSDE